MENPLMGPGIIEQIQSARMRRTESDRGCMLSMERSLRTLRNIVVWWFILSIACIVIGIFTFTIFYL